MKRLISTICLVFAIAITYAQEPTEVLGKVVNAATGFPLENVNIVNLNQIKGTSSNSKGEFELIAKANDTLHFSYLGFKSIKVRVTKDWIKFGRTKIELTELALALEEVVVTEFKLTGMLEVDIAQVPLNNTGYRYKISGLPTGYEAGRKAPGAVSRILGSIFNPADFLHRVFGKTPNELRKLKKMKKDDEIRTLLAQRFDREMLTELLGMTRVDLDEIVKQCKYSKDFINSANDLQILDAISECYEEYKVLSRGRKKRI